MVRRFALVLLFLLTAFIAAGGDIAVFENLGFSADSGVFLFGQYGVESEDGVPFAEVFAVDVARNVFVPNGMFVSRLDSGRPLSLGQDGRGALYKLVGEASTVISEYDIDHLNNGRPIYILVDGDEPKSRIAFRDFNTSIRYELNLDQRSRGTGEDVQAAFGIRLTVTHPDDRIDQISIGRPDYYRDGVTQYQITQVLLSPDEDSIIIVVEKWYENGTIRYMVETTPL